MECETYREALSARWDGEQEPVAAARTDEHLARCGGCRVWHRRAGDLSRALRVRPAAAVPDLTGRVLARVASQGLLAIGLVPLLAGYARSVHGASRVDRRRAA